nr:ABC transporter permease subunit [Mediterraneibacter glycyrrhizinilyticus]
MRRRAVSALTAAVLVTSLAVTGLTGCGSGNDGKESVRLMVWSPQGDQSVDQGQWLQTCCNAFAEEHPEWDITFVYGVADEASSAGQVSQDAEASADVFLYANDNLSVFSEEDVKNLDTMLEKGVVSFPFTNSWYLPAFYIGNGCTLFGDGTDASAGVDFGGEKAQEVTDYLIDLESDPNFRIDADGSGIAGLRDGSINAMFSGSWDAAALLDGCTRWQIFTKITLPLSKPIVIYTVLTSFMSPWLDFIFAKVICRANSDQYTIAIGLWNMLQKEYIDNWYTCFAAGAVLISVPIAALFLYMQRYYVDGLSGAVKG